MADPYEPDWIDKYRNYLHGTGPEAMRRATGMQRALNPVSVGQASQILGDEMTQGLADPNQFKPGSPQEIPSQVPHYNLTMPPSMGQPYPQTPVGPNGQPFDPNGPSVGSSIDPRYQGFNPAPSFGPPAPQDRLTPPEGPLSHSYDMGPREQPVLRAMGSPSVVPTPLTPPMQGGPQGPPTNEGSVSMRGMGPTAQLTPQEGPPLTVQGPPTLDPTSPANPLTRGFVEANEARSARWPTRGSMGMGGSAAVQAMEYKIHEMAKGMLELGEETDPDIALAKARRVVTGLAGYQSLDQSRQNQATQRDKALGYQEQGLGLKGRQVATGEKNAETAAKAQVETARANPEREAIARERNKNISDFNRQKILAFLSIQKLDPTEENIAMLADLQSFGLNQEMEAGTAPQFDLPLIGPVGTKPVIKKKGETVEQPVTPSTQALDVGQEGMDLMKEMEAKGGVKQYEGKLVMYKGKRYRIRNGKPVPEK